MFEIGNRVRFRHWVNQDWLPEDFIITEVELAFVNYGDEYYIYEIENIETGDKKTQVIWQQIELI